MTSTHSTPPPLPPHTVRIKRKRNQDPLQALLLGQTATAKRSRTNSYAATEDAPKHAGAITLREAPDRATGKQSSNVLETARNILNPARLFRFPTRKRRASQDEDAAREDSRTRPPPVRADQSVKPPPPPAEPSVVPVSQRNAVPTVKVLDHSPPQRPIAMPHSTSTAQRQRRQSSQSLSLSPTSSYQIPASNEDELQKMVDEFLQLNKEYEASKPSAALKRPHQHAAVAAVKQAPDTVSGTASPAHKARHINGTDAHRQAEQSQLLADKLAAAADGVTDSEVEDYVYDVYYREQYLGKTWDGGQYGLLLYNSDTDFADLVADDYYDEDEEGLSDDEDSNAEDFYQNDYPDEDEDGEIEYLSPAEEREEVDADDYDEYDYEEGYHRFADDDGEGDAVIASTLGDGNSDSLGATDVEFDYEDDLADPDRYRTRPRQFMPPEFADDEADDRDV